MDRCLFANHFGIPKELFCFICNFSFKILPYSLQHALSRLIYQNNWHFQYIFPHCCKKNVRYTNASEVTRNQMWLEDDQWHTRCDRQWLQSIFRYYGGICLYEVGITTNPPWTTTPQIQIQSHWRFKHNDSKFQVMCCSWCTLLDLMFSQWWLRRLLSIRMWYHVVRHKFKKVFSNMA
jgi:hypothetical protein